MASEESNLHESEAAASWKREIQRRQRFQFGANWASFLRTLDDDRIRVAVESVQGLLGVQDLVGRTFLDIGSGSGLFSLAARRLGASVHSFDYDPDSVACTQALQSQYFPGDGAWKVEQGSVLDTRYLQTLGQFDVVYSWGVLHHTGRMWAAIDNASQRVAPGGLFALALYNEQGVRTKVWKGVKRTYVSGPSGKLAMSAIFLPYFALRAVGQSVKSRENVFRAYRARRGMSIVHDWVDWLGGYPFDAAKPSEVAAFLEARGFAQQNLIETRGLGCNQFVFRRK
jgi:2-polyprenyl-6-hydroxyphenyl methylase/3-demethylubiquinone-9 3-methyltransferase